MTRTMDVCLNLNKFGEEVSEILSESAGNTAVLTVEMGTFLSFFFLSHPNFTPLSPDITWARGTISLRITW